MINLDRSFCLQANLWALSTVPSLYYPAHPEKLTKVETKSSLTETLKDVDVKWHEPVKHSKAMNAMHAVAQEVYIFATGLVLGPLGFLWHGGRALVFKAQYFMADTQKQTELMQKISENTKACFNDFMSFLIPGLIFVFPKIIIVLLVSEVIIRYVNPNTASAAILKGLETPEKGNLLRSFVLYQDFGICADNGALLPWNETTVAEDEQFHGPIGIALKKAAKEFLGLQKELQTKLQLTDEDAVALFNITDPQIFDDMMMNQYVRQGKISENDYVAWHGKYKIATKAFAVIATDFAAILECQNLQSLNELKYSAELWIYRAIAEARFEFFFGDESGTNPEDAWQAYLDKEIYKLRPEDSAVPSDDYGQFRTGIRRKETIEAVLGFDSMPDSEGEIRDAYRKIALQVHPDKVQTIAEQNAQLQNDNRLIAEANFLFTCATMARDLLLRNLRESAPPAVAPSNASDALDPPPQPSKAEVAKGPIIEGVD